MAPAKRKFFQYSQETLLAAIAEVHGGTSIRKAAINNQIPFGTLFNKVRGKYQVERRMGPPSVLTKEEEKLLCKWAEAQAKKGFPLKKRVLLETVEDIVKKDNRVTPFSNGKPGRKWYASFLKRNPTLKERFPDSINKARATVTEADLRQWFAELYKYLECENALDILEDPSRIFNADESGFQTCPTTGKVLGPISFENFYEVKSGSDKEAITVLGTFCANGDVCPGMIIYPLQRITREIVENVHEDWGIGRSKKGWMRGSTYFEYIANVFLPYLQKTGRQFPVLFLVDGHKSHLTYEVAKFCVEKKIFHFALFPNATHILQPADVAIFRPLKTRWREIVYDWKRKSGNKVVNKTVFGPLINAAFEQGATPTTIKNGFRKCGIYPFNPDAVDYSKCMADESRAVRNVNPADILNQKTGVESLLLVESLFPKGRAEQFKNNIGDWKGAKEAAELYDFWNNLKQFLKISPHSLPGGNITATGSGEAGTSTEAGTEDFEMEIPTTSTHEAPLTVSDADVDLLPKCSETPTTTPSHKAPVSKATVSPAFADIIVWPHDSPGKKKAKRRLPCAITSVGWMKSFEEKEKEKNEKELQKRQRMKQREENKLLKQKQKQRKSENENRKLGQPRGRQKTIVESDSSDSSAEVSSGESAWVESSDENVAKESRSWLAPEKYVGEFVITKYDETYFPGQIITLSDDDATVSSMTRCGRMWKWPERPDVLSYPWDSVVSRINEPKKVSTTRNVYSVPELDFTWN